MSKQTENMSLRSVVPTKEVEILDQPEKIKTLQKGQQQYQTKEVEKIIEEINNILTKRVSLGIGIAISKINETNKEKNIADGIQVK